MIPDPTHPETLLTVSTEIEAAAIVTALAEYDVEALTVGGYTSGFKAEAPGNVAVVVKLADFDRAKQALTKIQAEQTEIDWSKVDVTEDAASEPPPDGKRNRRLKLGRERGPPLVDSGPLGTRC